MRLTTVRRNQCPPQNLPAVPDPLGNPPDPCAQHRHDLGLAGATKAHPPKCIVPALSMLFLPHLPRMVPKCERRDQMISKITIELRLFLAFALLVALL